MTNHAVSNRADLRERTKTMSRHGDRRGQIADFRDSFETINWLYLLFKCGIKTKTHFEWLLWHWSSLGLLNLEPTRHNSRVGCKVPTDLVKISVKEATHMGFHYNYTQDIIYALCAIEPACLHSLKDNYTYNSIYPHPCGDDSNYSYPSLIRRGTNVCGHCAIYQKLIAVEWVSDEQKKIKLLKHKLKVISTTSTRMGCFLMWYTFSGPNRARQIRL